MQVYAETLGITGISEDALSTLSQDLEYRLRELIQVSPDTLIATNSRALGCKQVYAPFTQA